MFVHSNLNVSQRFLADIFTLVTCLSISRRAYLMFGSSNVMAALLFEKKSLKIRLMMPSKPPRISYEKGQKRESDSARQLALATNLFESAVGRFQLKPLLSNP